ncbi:Cytoplasmic dynein 1 intermediate chain, partial [Gryllus bimaculatus]
TFVYTRKRSDFGRQCLFSDEGPKLVENIVPDKTINAEYILKDPVDRSIQMGVMLSEHEANTTRAEYTDRGMNHNEGGWPRDINPLDIEQTTRYRKKVEKDENYIHTMLQLQLAMEHCILQNNAVNIYEEYYSDIEATMPVEHFTAQTVSVYRDICSIKRPITHISWSPDGGQRICVTHCNLEFQRSPPDLSTTSYIWEVENSNKPQMSLRTSVPQVCTEYNPKDQNTLVSGLFSGQVACWDVRRGELPVDVSLSEESHRDPVRNVLWINSKSGTEFFSSSFDGQVKWWDTRKLAAPTDEIVLDMEKVDEQVISRAVGASCLEYEPTIPTRFMVGTENGLVVGCNRKGKLPSEKITARFQAHLGPVYALQRNPGYSKNFLTVGDWTARVWSEDCKESSIIWTSFHRALLTDGAWSPTRHSVFYTTRMDGMLDVWDIIQEQREPSLSIKVCDFQLRCLRVHDQGLLIAVGNHIGTTYLVELSENLTTSQKSEKQQLSNLFERESRREKILEARIREIRLKQKSAKPEDRASKADLSDFEKQPAETATKEFYQVIQ